MRVYKFLTAEFALQNLIKRQIKISEFHDMNDPFELWGIKLSDPNVHHVAASHMMKSMVRYASLRIGKTRCSGASTATNTKAYVTEDSRRLTRL